MTLSGTSMGTMKYLARGLQLFQVFLSPSRTTTAQKEQSTCMERQLGNLHSDQLHHLASELLTLLQANPWESEYWCEFKSDVASLVQSLVGYAEYLSQKNKHMKLHHISATPVRELSSNLKVYSCIYHHPNINISD